EENRYTKPIVVLISEKTYSAGEDFVSAFLNTKRGEVIGRPTAGTTGNPIGFSLPGGGGFQICSKRDYLSTGEEFVGYGIQPTIRVEKTREPGHLVDAALRLLGKE
ncbi:MAG: S41 family peptidase, partial [Bacteroidota bacterium]